MRVILCLLLLAGCQALDPFAPTANVTRLDPPPGHFMVAFNWVRDHCTSGRSAVRADQVAYYRVDAPWWRREDTPDLIEGEWYPPATILLGAEAPDSAAGTTALRHEQLHAITGSGAHTPLYRSCDSLALVHGWSP